MNKEYTFSQEFMFEMANLLELCEKNKTDSMNISFDIGGKTLTIDISFSIK